MGLTVNTNIASINAQRNLGIANAQLATSLERLSSGLRINRAADDAAGLAIATKLGAQVRGLQQAARNANNTISLVQTAEGGLGVATNILQRLRELAVQSASDDNTTSDRKTLNAEAKQLREELTRLASVTEFNGSALLDGSFSGKKFQIGANSGQTISFSLSDARAQALGTFTSKTADVGDGASQGVAGAAGLSAGDFSINGTNILPTSASDDTVSVLVLGGSSVVDRTAPGGGALTIGDIDTAAGTELVINGTAIRVSTLAAGSAGVVSTNDLAATGIVAGINAAGVTDVTARVIDGSIVVLEAINGTDIKLDMANVTTLSTTVLAGFIGFSAAFVGSGTAVTTTNGQSSAIAKAAAVNVIAGTTNVDATVNATTIAFSKAVVGGAIAGGDLVINGVDIGTVTVSNNDSDGALVAAINVQSASTGVTASVSNGKLTLSAADGRNISLLAADLVGKTGVGGILGNNGGAGEISFGTGRVGIVRAGFDLKSIENIVIAGTTTQIGSIAATTYVATGNLSTLDLTSQSKATDAILQLDSALNTITSLRADIGAIQNRIQNTIEFLNVAAENQAAAESRIRDADFALETAKFTRAQILTQAATAILAQANSAPQIALQLLQ